MLGNAANLRPELHTVAKINAWRLVWVRVTLVVAMLAAMYFALRSMHFVMNYGVLVSIVACYCLLTFLYAFRLRFKRPVSAIELFCHIFLDLLLLSLWLYFAGGSTNPFISIFLVFLTISAALLPISYSSLLAGLSIALYTTLLFYYVPLESLESLSSSAEHAHHHMHADDDTGFFNLHILGMWLTFVVSAALVTFLVSRMAQTIREQDGLLAEQREKNLQDEQLLAVATQAAGTAHELGTPLSTIAMVVNELQATRSDDDQLQGDLNLLSQQIQLCKSNLQGLTQRAEHAYEQTTELESPQRFIEGCIETWQLMRPDADYEWGEVQTIEQRIEVGLALEQAIINLLNNATDASARNPEGEAERPKVRISLTVEGQTLELAIQDFGPGFDPEIAQHLGQPFVSDKEEGLGLGLYLTNATVTRYGGRVVLNNLASGGALTSIQLPLIPASANRGER